MYGMATTQPGDGKRHAVRDDLPDSCQQILATSMVSRAQVPSAARSRLLFWKCTVASKCHKVTIALNKQWTRSGKDAPAAWIVVLQLPFGTTLTAAEEALEKLGEPGFYRVVQMQRVIWAQEEDGAFKLRKSHASSPDGLRRCKTCLNGAAGAIHMRKSAPHVIYRRLREGLKKF
jgi:hypothetical protein